VFLINNKKKVIFLANVKSLSHQKFEGTTCYFN